MDQFAFAMAAMFGVPFGVVALLLLAYRLIPKAVWFSFAVQTVVTGLFLAALATPILVVKVDAQGEYFDGPEHLVGEAFGLPEEVTVNYQRDRTGRYGDCWRNAVNWRSDIEFASDAAFDAWLAQDGYRGRIVNQVAGYYGIEPERVTVEKGALDMRARDPKYELVDHHSAYSQNVRILEFYEPFVCTAIEQDDSGAITLRPCDPVSLAGDMGNQGRIIINPDARDRTLEGKIYYASGPHYCTNPVRRKVNALLGLPHPEGGKPNTNIGGILPL